MKLHEEKTIKRTTYAIVEERPDKFWIIKKIDKRQWMIQPARTYEKIKACFDRVIDKHK